ncbi:helix-turn-helix domain-containing protein, partial [Jeotgalibacillus marinus]
MKTIDKTFGFKLNDLFKKYKIKQKDVAEKCEITTSSLNKILNRESEHFFESILALVQYLVNLDECFEEEEELMRAYIQEIQD